MTELATPWEQLAGIMPRLGLALGVVALAFMIGRATARAFGFVLARAQLARVHQAFFRNLVTLVITLFGVSIALGILGLSGVAAGLLAGGGMAAIAIGFAFRGIGENLLAGLFLAFSRPFGPGDLISCAGFEGIVREVALRYTHVRAGDGRDIYIPNAIIFAQPLANFTRDGLRRPSFVIGVDYGDDLRRACELLQQTIAGIPGVLAKPPPTAVVAAFREHYAEIEMTFWINSFDAAVDFGRIRSAAMDLARKSLRAAGFTLSGEVSSRVVLSGKLETPDSGARA